MAGRPKSRARRIEERSLRVLAPRASSAEAKVQIQNAPPLNFPPPSPELLTELCLLYSEVTGAKVLKDRHSSLIAMTWRVHGDEFPARLDEIWSLSQTTTDLLLRLRCTGRGQPLLTRDRETAPAAPHPHDPAHPSWVEFDNHWTADRNLVKYFDDMGRARADDLLPVRRRAA